MIKPKRKKKRGQRMAASTTSKQDYGTPTVFTDAVQKRFGKIVFDLAAHNDGSNAVVDRWYGPRDNSLEQRWHRISKRGLLWLNPPFERIDLWVKKCAAEAALGARIALLIPASIDAVWFREHVLGKAMVLGLSPRITFVGETHPYPKPMMLVVYDSGMHGFDQWRWKPTRKEAQEAIYNAMR
jgi:phage N-6-adenine-methyltransferase